MSPWIAFVESHSVLAFSKLPTSQAGITGPGARPSSPPQRSALDQRCSRRSLRRLRPAARGWPGCPFIPVLKNLEASSSRGDVGTGRAGVTHRATVASSLRHCGFSEPLPKRSLLQHPRALPRGPGWALQRPPWARPRPASRGSSRGPSLASGLQTCRAGSQDPPGQPRHLRAPPTPQRGQRRRSWPDAHSSRARAAC